MFTPEKIEEWIQEAQKRPSSASLIIQFIANRLNDLAEWNEKLRAENLEVRSGARLEEYERQITHLEYQLELLKRQINGEINLEVLPEAAPKLDTVSLCLLAYDPQGRILRWDLDAAHFEEGQVVARMAEIRDVEVEPPRLLVVPAVEELMLIFTSGRIVTLPVSALLPGPRVEKPISWETASQPSEPNVGETLACIAPVSKMALADFFLQISRRGYIKKIRKALAPTIMESKYIGTGVKVSGDQTLSLALSSEGKSFVLVSYEGYLQAIPDKLLPYAIVEAMRLGNSDHLVAAYPTAEDQSIFVMTQIGKVIHRAAGDLEPAADLKRKGRMLYSTARREAGIRVIGAAAVSPGDWGLALHRPGEVSLHAIADLIGRGTLLVDRPAEGSPDLGLLDFVTFPGPEAAPPGR